LTPDATSVRDLELTGLVDLSDVIVGIDVACGVAEGLGAPCEPCTADATEPTCVRVRIRDPEAVTWDGVLSMEAEVCE
ncbi:MAG: hypothetical protein ACK4YP_20105, partial [Myxococcota bacterium]